MRLTGTYYAVIELTFSTGKMGQITALYDDEAEAREHHKALKQKYKAVGKHGDVIFREINLIVSDNLP